MALWRFYQQKITRLWSTTDTGNELNYNDESPIFVSLYCGTNLDYM